MRWAPVRPMIVAAMLGLTSVFAAILAAEAVIAERSHHLAAERVLHDYAALGAEGVAQRLKTALNGRFSSVLLASASLMDGHSSVPLSVVRSHIAGSASDVLVDSSRILSVSAGDSLAPTLAEVTTSLPSYAYFGLMWRTTEHGTELVVFQPLRDLSRGVTLFTLPQKAVEALLSRLVANDPVLPASVTHGVAVGRGIGLRVTSARGDLARRGIDSASPFRAAVSLGQPFGDLGVEVSLNESLAPTLIIGGLPTSRMPLLIALLILTIALTAAAGDQLRRELELARLRDDFVSSVSHELRTPLAQIRMFAETLRLGRVRSPDEAERSLTIVENEAKRLEHLVENVLTISRAERRVFETHRAPTNVTSLVQEVVSEFAPLTVKSESRLALDLAPAVIADVDPSAVRQIVINLLDNAVKYGAHGQAITVRLRSGNGEMRLEVEDGGAGVARVDRTRAWERFWRSESARVSGVTGTGVGLAIVAELVRLHRGTAAIEDAPGGGARVVIVLPVDGRP